MRRTWAVMVLTCAIVASACTQTHTGNRAVYNTVVAGGYSVKDSLLLLRSDLTKARDSLVSHLTQLARVRDSASVLRTDLTRSRDSVTVLRTDLTKARDSVAAVRASLTQVNAAILTRLADSIIALKIRDTSLVNTSARQLGQMTKDSANSVRASAFRADTASLTRDRRLSDSLLLASLRLDTVRATLAAGGGIGSGTVYLSGDGPPSSLIGNNGDVYFDRIRKVRYEKLEGQWRQ